MPKGQAPYVPKSRKLKAISAELISKGLIDPPPNVGNAGEILRSYGMSEGFKDTRVHKERDTQTQRFKSRKVP